MNAPPPFPANMVIYAKDIEKVAAFYERTLSLRVLEKAPGFTVLGDGNFELSVVQIPPAIAKEIDISVPPRLREQTPLKFSFLVADLNLVGREATAAGGGTKPLAAAWRWHNQLHLDGYDPEGNVVQFRVRDG